MASVAENLNLTLRKQISAKIQRLPLRFFDRNKPGEVLSKVTNDLDRISEVMQTGLLRLITAITTVTGSLVIMVYYSWLLTVVFLVFMALSMHPKSRAARRLHHDIRQSSDPHDRAVLADGGDAARRLDGTWRPHDRRRGAGVLPIHQPGVRTADRSQLHDQLAAVRARVRRTHLRAVGRGRGTARPPAS